MELTLLEVHLDDASFTANAPFSDDSSEEQIESTDVAPTDGDDDGPSLLPFLVVLGALAGLAYLVRRFRSGGEAATSIEPEVTEPEAPTP